MSRHHGGDDDDVSVARYEGPPAYNIKSDGLLDTEKIYCVDVHPTQPLLAIGTESSLVKIYSLKVHEYVDVLPQVGRVLAVRFSPCGTYLATAGSSEEQEAFRISIWRIAGGDEYVKFNIMTDDMKIRDTPDNFGPAKLHQGDITSLDFRPTQGQSVVLASGSADQTVRLWHIGRVDAMMRTIWRKHNGEVTCVRWSDQGRLLASSSLDKTIIVWRLLMKSKVELHQHVQFDCHEVPYSLSFFPKHQAHKNYMNKNLRYWHLVAGTERSLQLFAVKECWVPPEERPLYFTQHAIPNDHPIFTDFAADGEHQPVMIVREKSFATRRGYDENQYAQEDSEQNFLAVTQLQRVKHAHGIHTVYAGFHTEDGIRGGCDLILAGGFKGQVSAYAVVINRNDDFNPFLIRHHPLMTHQGAVTQVVFPSAKLRREFLDGAYIAANQHFGISSSIDETVNIFKFAVRAQPDGRGNYNFTALAPDLKKDTPLVLERPLTENKSKQLFAINESLRKAESEAKKRFEIEMERRKKELEEKANKGADRKTNNASALQRANMWMAGRMVGQKIGQPVSSNVEAKKELERGTSKLVNFQMLAKRQEQLGKGGAPGSGPGKGGDGCIVM